ncbi:hypothetical protein, partial [Sphingobacterium yanglingense]
GDVVTNIKNEGAIYNEIINILNAKTDLFVDNGDGTFTHTTVDGKEVKFDANTLTMLDNNDGTYTFTNANGETVTVDVIGDVVTNIKNEGAIYNEIINILNAKTDLFVDNGDGTFTHTTVDGKEVKFDANTTSVEVADGVYTFKNGKGETIATIDTNVDAAEVTYDGTNSGLSSNNVKDAIDELVTNINAKKGDLSLETGVLEFLDNTNGTDKLLAAAKIGIVDGAITTEKIKDGEVKTADIADKNVTADKLGADPTDKGKVGVVQSDGSVVYQKIDVSNINAKNLTSGSTVLEVTGGIGATLVDASVKFANAEADKVLVTDDQGNVIWVDQSEVGEIVSADNGLTKTDKNIQLGGDLLKQTTIGTSADKTLAITGLDKKKTQAVNATEGFAQHLLAVDKNGDIIKALKAAMPKFFYMPSVMVPTAESQATQEGVTYNNTSRTGTINLYTIYKKQFGSPVMSSAGASSLPVLPASELGFHVTYATEGVFTIKSITAEGLMTYEVSSTANINVGSFINIVFSVKED